MITRGITVLFLFLITFVISCSAQCDCYAYWICNGPATIVYPDQCSTGPPDYYGAGAVLDGSTGLGDTYLIHTTNPDQAYRLIGDCVEHVTFGNCPTAPEQIRTDLSIEYTCDETALCLADEPTPASLSTYTFDQSGATIGCNNTCFSLATNCTVTEGLVPNACAAASTTTTTSCPYGCPEQDNLTGHYLAVIPQGGNIFECEYDDGNQCQYFLDGALSSEDIPNGCPILATCGINLFSTASP